MTEDNFTREKMEYDLVIVGAGPSGLSAAINFKKICQLKNKDFSVCIVEKGSEVKIYYQGSSRANNFK